jgi:hypothetical protein
MISAPSSVMPTIAAQVSACGFCSAGEHLFQTLNLAFGLTAMLFEGSPQFLILGSFRHFG